MSVDISHLYSYHSINLTSGKLSRSQKQEESPINTCPIGSPAIVFTLSPLLSSVRVFHIDCGIDVSSGTHTRHTLGSFVPILFSDWQWQGWWWSYLKLMISLHHCIVYVHFNHVSGISEKWNTIDWTPCCTGSPLMER